MILTNTERTRFIEWLKAEIESNKAILKQMEIMPAVVMEALIKKKKMEMAAEIIVLRMLDSLSTEAQQREHNQDKT